MKDQYEELPESEQTLAAARARGDFVINSALDWIDRFHMQASPPLMMDLTKGIRSLSKAMQGRSADEIVDGINGLLNTHAQLSLPGGQTEGTHGLASPRIHDRWSQSRYFSPHEHLDRSAVQKRGPVFVSYARADSHWLKRLQIHLRPLERSGRIDLWHDGRLRPGEAWRPELKRVLNAASSAILLVTANFMASDFIYSNELQPIAKRARDGGVVVFPVIVGHCLLEEDQYLRDFQLFNDPEMPLSRLDPSEVDRVLVSLAKAVRELCEETRRSHDGS